MLSPLRIFRCIRNRSNSEKKLDGTKWARNLLFNTGYWFFSILLRELYHLRQLAEPSLLGKMRFARLKSILQCHSRSCNHWTAAFPRSPLKSLTFFKACLYLSCSSDKLYDAAMLNIRRISRSPSIVWSGHRSTKFATTCCVCEGFSVLIIAKWRVRNLYVCCSEYSSRISSYNHEDYSSELVFDFVIVS